MRKKRKGTTRTTAYPKRQIARRAISRIEARDRGRPFPSFGGNPTDVVEEHQTPDLRLKGSRRHDVRTRTFSVVPTRAGVLQDPTTAFGYYVRQRLASRSPEPAKLIDPQTRQVFAYMDSVTRRVWADAACTIPYVKPEP